MGELIDPAVKPNYNVSFHNDQGEVCRLDFNGPALVITGNVDDSARVILDWVATTFAQRLKDEREAGRREANVPTL